MPPHPYRQFQTYLEGEEDIVYLFRFTLLVCFASYVTIVCFERLCELYY